MLTPTRVPNERGLIVVWFTLLLTVMVGLAALVVDLGVGREKSRQAQNAADAAALGGAQKLPDLTATATDAKALGDTNVPGVTLAWTGCADSGHLAVQTTPPSCISFDNSFTKVRVRLPSQSLPSIFGGIFGVKSLSVGTAAEAQVVRAAVGGATMPFAIYNDRPSETRCASRLAPTAAPRSRETSARSTSRPTSTGAPETRTATSPVISRPASTTSSPSTRCPAPPYLSPTPISDGCDTAGPNTLDTRTGSPSSNEVDPGILSGSGLPTGTLALLQQGANPKVTVAGNSVDNRPLWEFISPDASLSNVPLTCKHGGANGFDAKLAAAYATPAVKQAALHAQILLCIAQYNSGGLAVGCSSVPCTGVLFGANTSSEAPIDVFDIQQSPRFVEVPQMWETTAPVGTKAVHVMTFQPFFVQRLVGKKNLDFEPGPWNTPPNPAPGGTTVQAIAAFKIPPTMLPGNIGQPNVIGQTSYVQLVR